MRRSLAVSRRLMPSPSITTTLHRGFPCSYASGEATVQMTSTSGVCVSVSACLSMSRFHAMELETLGTHYHCSRWRTSRTNPSMGYRDFKQPVLKGNVSMTSAQFTCAARTGASLSGRKRVKK